MLASRLCHTCSGSLAAASSTAARVASAGHAAQAVVMRDVSLITGDPVKAFLGLVSLCYDLLLMVRPCNWLLLSSLWKTV